MADLKPLSSVTLLSNLGDEPITNLAAREVVNTHGACMPVAGRIVGFYRDLQQDRNGYPNTRLWALVAQHRDERLAELEKELATSRGDLNLMREKAVTAEASLKITITERDRAQSLGEQWQKAHGVEEKRKSEAQALRRKLEEDLAKVKKHFGEKAFAEALAAVKG